MKKIKLIICLIVISMLTFTACAGNTPGDTTVTDTPTDSTATTTKTQESTTPEETTAPPEINVPSSHNLQFENNKQGIYNYCPVAMQMPDGTIYIYITVRTLNRTRSSTISDAVKEQRTKTAR